MGAGLHLGRLRLRRHRRATVLLTLLVGVAVAVALAAFTGARRTDAALPAMLRTHHAADALLTFVPQAFGGSASADLGPEVAAVRAIPGVRSAKRVTNGIVSLPARGRGYSNSHVLAYVSIDDGGTAALGHPYVLAGRSPDERRANEVAVDEELARDANLHVGSTFRLAAFTVDQGDEVLDPAAMAAGLSVDARVTAVVRHPYDLRDLSAPRNPDDMFEGHYDLYLTAAFWRAAGGDIFGYNPSVAVALERGASGLAPFRRAVASAVPGAPDVSSTNDFLLGAGTLDGVAHAVSVQSRSLQVFGLLAALAGLFLTGQTVGRQSRVESNDNEVLRAVGLTAGQQRTALLVRVGVAAVAGAAIGATLAIALSPLTPLPGSTARRAVLHPGVDPDWPVLLGGSAAAVVAVMLIALVMGRLRPAAAATAPPGIVARLGAAGLPPAPTIGARFAVERGRGTRAVPVRAALVSGVIAVVAAVGAAVFGSSLATLRHDPELYGVTWDVSVGGASTVEEAAGDLATLRRTRGLAAYSGVTSVPVEIAGKRVLTMVVWPGRGTVLPTIAEGRAPAHDREIVLGGNTMRDLGVGLGDPVQVGTGGRRPVLFTVVGRAVLNAAGIERTLVLGHGALILDGSLDRVVGAEAASQTAPESWFVRIAPGADRTAVLTALHRAFPATTTGPLQPADIETLAEVTSLPFMFPLVVAVLGLGTIAHALLTAVRRRQHDLAVLKTIGFTRVQVATVITTQAATFAVIALLLGIPLGVALGRATWTLAADALSVAVRTTVPLARTAEGCAALLAVAVITALVPATLASRASVATVLRRD